MTASDQPPFEVVTVTLNPAIDRTVTIPGFTAGAVNRVTLQRSSPGGKGVNVASALADFGHRVAATGFLGKENAGVFEELFQRKGITDRFIRVGGETRVGIKITDPERGETTDINFPGASPTAAQLQALHAELAAIPAAPGAWFVLAGSIPPDVPVEIYRGLGATLRARGYRIALDTSGAPLAPALEAAPHLIKPNIHELEELIGRPLTTHQEVVQAARELIVRGVELVTVSMGAEGALLVTAIQQVHAVPPAITVQSTVGAGDAMVAGLIAASLRQLPLPDAAKMGTAFSLEALIGGDSAARSPQAIEKRMLSIDVS